MLRNYQGDVEVIMCFIECINLIADFNCFVLAPLFALILPLTSVYLPFQTTDNSPCRGLENTQNIEWFSERNTSINCCEHVSLAGAAG